jgi:hypothetical protein
MAARLSVLLLSILLCPTSWAQGSNILSTVSPKLRKFLIDHPAATKVFTNTFAEAFSNRTVSLHYFYSDDDSEARAFHYYPDTPGLAEVIICVRENQIPLDELITTLFEVLNSKGEDQFAKIFDAAKAGTISRTEFAKAILRVEFEATKNMQKLVVPLQLKETEKAESHYYKIYVGCPTGFDEFLSYSKKVSGNRDVVKDYESKYDALRKMP